MNLKALQSLVAIHDTRSFGETARRLGLSQSAVSMQIKALEEELGVELFDRSVRPPVMTPSAVAIVNPVRRILANLEEIEEIVKTQAPLTGQLRLGAIPTATLALLPDGMAATVRRYPGIQITIESGLSAPLAAHVQEGLLDAAVITEPPSVSSELHCEVIIRERLALASTRNMRSPIGLPKVLDYPFIRFNRRIGVGAIVDHFLAKKGLAPDEFMELDSIEAILAMVERGLGIAIVPEDSIGSSYRDRVLLSPIEDPDAYRNVSFIFRVDSARKPLLEVVLEALKEAARKI